MIYHQLINTALQIPLFSLGTMMFGGQTDETESLRIMEYALEQGVNLFDTANIYNAGASERIVGKALKNRREKILLTTKVGYHMGKGLTEVSLKKTDIQEGIDASLSKAARIPPLLSLHCFL